MQQTLAEYRERQAHCAMVRNAQQMRRTYWQDKACACEIALAQTARLWQQDRDTTE